MESGLQLVRLEVFQEQITAFSGAWTPLVLIGLFLFSSFLIIWRLEMMSQRGVEGTVLGTLFMPYFSGLGNLIFIGVVIRQNGPSEEVIINSWTNNITNLCLLLTLPALIWGLRVGGESKTKKARRDSKLHQLSLALTLIAMVFFTFVVWMLGQDGRIDRFDGFALVGLFFFWQCFHVYEVLKENTRQSRSWHPAILFDLALILVGSFFTLVSVDGIVARILASDNEFIGPERLGLLTGGLMVLPNAILAFYYASRRRADVVYSSQIGDAHICIPLCIGAFAIFRPMELPRFFNEGLLFLAAAALIHLLCIVFFRRLPKLVALALIVAFGYALYWQAG